jgi:hypothetical protein
MPLRRKNWQVEAKKFVDHEPLLQVRTRFLAAELVLTPGAVVLPATSRARYRLIDATVIAVGATVAGATSVDITGTRAGAKVILVTMPVASLTRGTALRMGAAGSTILTDGGSTDLLDSNTGINIERVGAAVSGATAVDVLLTYALEIGSMLSGA